MKILYILAVCLSLTGCTLPSGDHMTFSQFMTGACGATSDSMGAYQQNQNNEQNFKQQQDIYNSQHP